MPGDFSQYAVQIMLNIPIGEADYPDTLFVQPIRSGLVVALLGRIGVAIAIDFDGELVLVTVKV